jgi:hypothetical protein
VIHLYAVSAAKAEPVATSGLDDAPVEWHEVDGLALALSRHAAAPPGTEESLLRHAAVVEAIAERAAAVLPARFGVAFADEAALERSVRERRAALGDVLDRVRGRIELGVRVLAAPAPAEPSSAATGGEYLRARLRETTEREGLASAIHDALAARSEDARRAPASPTLLLSAAYLVPSDGVAGFRETVHGLELAHPALSILCTGPWPPYSFASGDAGGAS